MTTADSGFTELDGFEIGLFTPITGEDEARIRMRENGFMSFYTNVDERMRITAIGDIEIGIATTPSVIIKRSGEIIVDNPGVMNSLGTLGYALMSSLNEPNLNDDSPVLDFTTSRLDITTGEGSATPFSRVIIHFNCRFVAANSESDPRILMRFFDGIDGSNEISGSNDYNYEVTDFNGFTFFSVSDNKMVVFSANNVGGRGYGMGVITLDTSTFEGESGYCQGTCVSRFTSENGVKLGGTNASFGIINSTNIQTRITAVGFAYLNGQMIGSANRFHARAWRLI